MRALRVDHIRVVYGRAADARPAVDDFSLSLEAGDIACLLGPSGCGKTTVLRAIAGLEPLRAGRIALGDLALSGDGVHLPPEQRRLGMMFQEGALFPHLDAAGNIGFGLRRMPRHERERRVDELLALVGLQGLAGRYAHELSGGQQQRVALARALAPAPRLLLLDEPFSSLDSATRERLTRETRAILKAAGQTALMVTHEALDARTLGDWTGQMHDGRLVSWKPGAG